MSIVLRINKGTALTYDELDRNQAQFYYSSSIQDSGTTLRLHYSGSTALGVGYENGRYTDVPLGADGGTTIISGSTASAAGSNTQIQYNDNGAFGASSNLTYASGKLSLKTPSTGTSKFAQTDFYSIGTLAGRVGKIYDTSKDIYLTANSSNYLKFQVNNTLTANPIATLSSTGLGVGTGNNTGFAQRITTVSSTLGLGIAKTTDYVNTQNKIRPVIADIVNNLSGGLERLIPVGSFSQGLLLESPTGTDGGNVVVMVNTDSNKKEGFNIDWADGGNYTSTTGTANGVIATFQASGKIGFNTNNPSDIGITVAGIISGSGDADFDGDIDGGGTLNIGGNTTLGGTLNVTGFISGSGGMNIAGNITGKSTLKIVGATTLSNTLNVTGAVTAGSSIVATGNVTANKLIKQGGTSTQILLANGDTTTIGTGAGGSVVTNVASNFTTTTGYQRLSTGLIIQFGYVSGGTTEPTITFPIAFPTRCVSVTCSTDRTSSGSRGTNHVYNVSTTACTLVIDGGTGRWMAMGY